ncbi:MAG: hypothetical protein K2X09_05880 [Rickettsiales bacterium]|nr:hypothetical protein [Rickettsiales bacterium]
MNQSSDHKILIVSSALDGLSDSKKEIIEREAEHNLDRLHANEESLESRLTIFLSISITVISVILGYVLVRPKDSTDFLENQHLIAIITAIFLYVACFVFIRGLFPKADYWSKGHEPFHILNDKDIVSKTDKEFRDCVILGMQMRCDRIDYRNQRLAKNLKLGLIIMGLAPFAGALLAKLHTLILVCPWRL